MSNLPACRQRGPAVAEDRWICNSQQLVIPGRVVSGDVCRHVCAYVDQESQLASACLPESNWSDETVVGLIGKLRRFPVDLPTGWQWRESVQVAQRRLFDAAVGEPPVVSLGNRERGIVIAAGGPVYFPCAYALVNLLRDLGCRLPIECWHLGPDEIPPRLARWLEPLDVVCRDARAVQPQPRQLCGWGLKPLAVAHSDFREVLFLDADNVVLRDPTFLFDQPEYRQAGAIFWPDLAGDSYVTSVTWDIAGIAWREGPAFESGQFLIDKSKCPRELGLALHLNAHSDFWYQYVYGDKDTFKLAWHKLDRRYAIPATAARWQWPAIQQFDLRGEQLFAHCCQGKQLLREGRDDPRIPHAARIAEFAGRIRNELAAVWGPVDQRSRHPIAPPVSQSEIEAVVQRLPPYPTDRFSGRGIVTSAGGRKYQVCAYVLFALLRKLGCELPIECWYLGEAERNPLWEDAVRREFGVRCVDAIAEGFVTIPEDLAPTCQGREYPPGALNGYGLKVFAIEHSKFEQVLWLDADNCPQRDPTTLFDEGPYQQHGAVFWPDLPDRRLPPEAWSVFGAGVPRDEADFEAGQLLIDKHRCWSAVQLTSFFNRRRDHFFRYVWGDKDLFHLAWRKLGQDFAMPPFSCRWADVAIVQQDFAGEPMFFHRVVGNKFSLDRINVAVVGDPHHDFACNTLRQLAERSETWWTDGGLSMSQDTLIRTANEFHGMFAQAMEACDWTPHPRWSVFTQYDRSYYLRDKSGFLRKYRSMWAVSRVIAARSLIELGVQAGSSADAYLSAHPNMRYTGIDLFTDGHPDEVTGEPWRPREIAEQLFADRSFPNCSLVCHNLRELTTLAPAEWVVVDAAHDTFNESEDLKLALTANPAWIFVDDTNSPEVRGVVDDFCQRHAARILFRVEIDYPNGGTVLRLRQSKSALTNSRN